MFIRFLIFNFTPHHLFLVMILKMHSFLVNHTNSVLGKFRNHRTKLKNNIKIQKYEWHYRAALYF